MGHYCRICERSRPNEKFSGKGHRQHICKECKKKPKDEIAEIETLQEIWDYLRQSNISKKNISRLKILVNSENKEISKLSNVVLEVAMVKPHKRRRLKFLAKNNRDLLIKLRETGLIDAHHW